MGYACPVCEAPQQDGEHLANHLAFTAMLRDDEHREWLDEHAPGWNEDSPDKLADRVTDHAAEAEFDAVFEDTTDDDAHRGDVDLLAGPEPKTGAGTGRVDDDTAAVLDEARALTEEMLREEGVTDEDGDGGASVADHDGDDDEASDDDTADADDPA